MVTFTLHTFSCPTSYAGVKRCHGEHGKYYLHSRVKPHREDLVLSTSPVSPRAYKVYANRHAVVASKAALASHFKLYIGTEVRVSDKNNLMSQIRG